MIEFPKGVKFSELQGKTSREDLIDAHNESMDYLLALIEDLPDSFVTFVPDDPEAKDDFADDTEDAAIAWTLGHLIVHVTASCEESAARSASLARGIQVEWRNRYETPWEEVKTITNLKLRLEESRRMRISYLNAWPDNPHFDNLWVKMEKYWGKLDARGSVLAGLNHETGHYEQIEEVIRQARTAENSTDNGGKTHQAV